MNYKNDLKSAPSINHYVNLKYEIIDRYSKHTNDQIATFLLDLSHILAPSLTACADK